MKIIFFIVIIINANLTFSQSKKEQIKILKENIENLKNELENERNSKIKKTNELNSVVANYESQISSLKIEVANNTFSLNQKKIENNQLKKEYQDSITYYKNKLNTTNEFYTVFLKEQGIMQNFEAVKQPMTPDGIKEIGNLTIVTRSALLNPESEFGHEYEYKTTSSFYLFRDNTYQQVKLEDCFNSNKNELLAIITNEIKEILKNPDELDPCGTIKYQVKLPLDFDNLLFFVTAAEEGEAESYCFSFADNDLCGEGSTGETCFSKEQMLKYLK